MNKSKIIVLVLFLSILGNIYQFTQYRNVRLANEIQWYDLQLNRISYLQQLSTYLRSVLDEPDNELNVSLLMGNFYAVEALRANNPYMFYDFPELRTSLALLSEQSNIIHQMYFARLQFREISQNEFEQLQEFQSNFEKATSELDAMRVEALQSGEANKYMRETSPEVLNNIYSYLKANEELPVISGFR